MGTFLEQELERRNSQSDLTIFDLFPNSSHKPSPTEPQNTTPKEPDSSVQFRQFTDREFLNCDQEILNIPTSDVSILVNQNLGIIFPHIFNLETDTLHYLVKNVDNPNFIKELYDNINMQYTIINRDAGTNNAIDIDHGLQFLKSLLLKLEVSEIRTAAKIKAAASDIARESENPEKAKQLEEFAIASILGKVSQSKKTKTEEFRYRSIQELNDLLELEQNPEKKQEIIENIALASEVTATLEALSEYPDQLANLLMSQQFSPVNLAKLIQMLDSATLAIVLNKIGDKNPDLMCEILDKIYEGSEKRNNKFIAFRKAARSLNIQNLNHYIKHVKGQQKEKSSSKLGIITEETAMKMVLNCTPDQLRKILKDGMPQVAAAIERQLNKSSDSVHIKVASTMAQGITSIFNKLANKYPHFDKDKQFEDKSETTETNKTTADKNNKSTDKSATSKADKESKKIEASKKNEDADKKQHQDEGDKLRQRDAKQHIPPDLIKQIGAMLTQESGLVLSENDVKSIMSMTGLGQQSGLKEVATVASALKAHKEVAAAVIEGKQIANAR